MYDYSSYDYTRPVKDYVGSDLERRPTRRGQHPNVVRDDRNVNPQGMYEHEGQPLGKTIPAKKEDGFWSGVLLAGAAIGLGYLMFSGDKQKQEEDVRSTPEPAPLPPAQPQAPQVVVVHTGGQVPVAVPTFTVPAIAEKTLDVSSKIIDVEPIDKKRTRKTTQARDENGHYLPAGTRARAVTEGKQK